ncbi:HDOD domain-containing protein [Desulfatiferula olefinivorans]
MTDRTDKKGFDFDPIDLSALFPAGVPAKRPDATPAGDSQDPGALEAGRVDRVIETLFELMRKKGDFPSFSRQIVEVNKILKLKYSSARDIANVIMKDFSLSNKLLKLVNSSFYGQFSKNGISSVSSAMIILGADQIQQAAASLMLFEHMQANAQSQGLKDITVNTFMSGLMAKDLAVGAGIHDTEEFQVCAMFHSLGENLIAFYFPDKYQRILEIEKRKGMDREQAARKVLTISFRDLGIGVAKKWGIPASIVRSMACDPLTSPPVGDRAYSRDDRLGFISAFSNALCRVYQSDDAGQRDRDIARLIEGYKGLVDIRVDDIEGLLGRVSEKVKVHAAQLNINIGKSRLIKNMQQKDGEPDTETPASASPADVRKSTPAEVRKRIYKDIKRIEAVLAGDFAIGQVLMDILSVMHREFDYDRIAICIRDAARNVIGIRHGLGKDIDALSREFRFPITTVQDIFHLSLSREKDYSIPDINDAKFKALIPTWYRMMNMASGFDLFALVIDHVPIGFFYADHEAPREFTPMEDLKNMKKLRNLAEKAIRIRKNQR